MQQLSHRSKQAFRKIQSPTMNYDPVTAGPRATNGEVHKKPIATYHDKQYKVIKEGTAEVLELQHPNDSKGPRNEEPKSQSVFYNPVQQYNRDLSVLAIKAFGEDLAAVRKARHQRRRQQLAKGDLRGKKRKGAPSEDTGEIGQHSKEDASEREPKRSKVGEPEQSAKADKLAVGHECDINPQDETRAKGNQGAEDGEQEVDEAANVMIAEAANVVIADTKDKLVGMPQNTHSPFRILDALSATGLRALRYAQEIPTVTSVTANDLSAAATAAIRLNVDHNKLADKIIVNTSDAIEHMQNAASHHQRTRTVYEVIDIDPYGTAAPFLDSAVQALVDGGMLCVTCTDAAVFASTGYLEKTYSQYGGLPMKGPHAHEGGLRLILHAIAASAARYGLAIEPLLSLSIDFYARVFVRVHRSAAEVKFLASKTMIVYSCDTGCGAWTTQHFVRPNKKEAKNGDTFYTFSSTIAPPASMQCEHCGFKTHQAGPMWGGPLHNSHFIQRVLDMLPTLDRSIYGTVPRIEGMLSVALNEHLDDAPSDPSKGAKPPPDRPIPVTDPANRSLHPFFFLAPSLAKILHCVSPSDAAIRGALIHLGYRTTRSHTKAGSICTDAPWKVIWEIMREWVRQKSPLKEGAVKERTAGWGIMQKDRSKVRLNNAKEAFQQVIASQTATSFADLKKNIEALLYQLSKDEERTSDEAFSEPFTDGTIKSTDRDHSGKVISESGTGTEAKGRKSDKETGKSGQASAESDCSTLKIVFDEKLGKESQGKRLVRYQANPRPDWGPMNRAKGNS